MVNKERPLQKTDLIMARGFRKYDMPFIMSVLDALYQNSNDVNKTSLQMEVHRETIMRWSEKHGAAYNAQRQLQTIDNAIIQTSPSMERLREDAATNLESVKEMILIRMKEIIPGTKNLDQLSRAYKTLYECINGIKDGDLPEDKSFLQIINLQINGMKGQIEGETKDIEYESTND